MSTPDSELTMPRHVPATVRFVPTTDSERSEWLDALRGFALLGILLYNMQVFSGFVFQGLMPPAQRWGEGLDATLDFWAHVLIQGKFYSLFSFLFGLGFALQLQRLGSGARHELSVLRRRLGWLLAFGLAHAVLIWFGDILTVYAVFGFALLALRHLSQRALLVTALCFLGSPVVLYLVLLAIGIGDPLAIDPSLPPQQSPIGQTVRTVAQGGYVDVVQSNAVLYPLGWVRRAVQLSLPRIFGMFLLGVWAARAGLPGTGPRQDALLRAWLGCGVAFGVPANIALSILGGNDALFPTSAEGLLAVSLAAVGMPLLCLGYVGAFGVYWRKARPAHLLVAAGRTALSQYLGQSVVCVALFYGFGLGLFGRVSYAMALLIALAVYLLLSSLGRAWLARFAQGPMEGLWRRLSYGRTSRLSLADGP